MYIANIRSRVFRKFLLSSQVNQYLNHFLLKVFRVKCWTFHELNSLSLVRLMKSLTFGLGLNTVEPRYFEVPTKMEKKFEVAGFRNNRVLRSVKFVTMNRFQCTPWMLYSFCNMPLLIVLWKLMHVHRN